MTDIINEISINLSKDQQIAFDLIKQGHTVFITSAAGSGKSFLLKHIIEYLSEIYNPLDGSYAVTSLTGISSIQIEGQTLHSWAGIGLGEENAPILISKIKKRLFDIRWKAIKVLIIDEISMMSLDLFEKLHYIGCHFRQCYNKLFGGIQLIFSGDMLQLAPIGIGRKGQFCFESDIWKRYITHIVLLQKNFRQITDKDFQLMLNDIRIGKITAHTKKVLNSRLVKKVPPMAVKPTKLYPFNKDVDVINSNEYTKLIVAGAITHDYLPIITCTRIDRFEIPNYNDHRNDIIDKQNRLLNIVEDLSHGLGDPEVEFGNKPQIKTVRLCIGAQIMLNYNINVASGLANGLRGVVMGFDSLNNPIINFDKQPNPLTIVRLDINFVYNYCKVVINQYPLQHCWASTIHRSQAQTLSKVVTDLAFIFCPGQAYVCLSRVQSLDGLYLKAIDFNKIVCDERAKAFYDTIGYHCKYQYTQKCKKDSFVPSSVFPGQKLNRPDICADCYCIFLHQLYNCHENVAKKITEYVD